MPNLDLVIWHTPHPLATQALLRLNDRGVRQIFVVPTDNLTSIKMPTCAQDWQSAYHAFAWFWAAKGVRHVIVPEPTYLPSKRVMRSFSSTLHSHGLQVEFAAGKAKALLEAVHRH